MEHKLLFDRVLSVATGVLTICAVLVVALRVRAGFSTPTSSDDSTPQHIAGWQRYSAAGQRSGAARPSVTIVEFADFQCPFCAAASDYLNGLQRRYPSEIAVVYRHYPIHQFATTAAVASECAGDVGAFQQLHDLFYSQKDAIGKRPWMSFASSAGVSDTARFARCMADPTVVARVVRDTLAASQLGIHGTPTFLINDLKVRGFPGVETMNMYVAEELRRSKR
jgi:protein-disulfide isomerase